MGSFAGFESFLHFIGKKGQTMPDLLSKQLKCFTYICEEMDAAYHKASLKLGLSDSECMILYSIRSRGNSCLLRDITALGVSKQTVNSALRKLEREGIVYLETLDGNRKKICLTGKGVKRVADTVDKLIKIENEALATWSSAELEQYIALSKRYLRDFNEKINEL